MNSVTRLLARIGRSGALPSWAVTPFRLSSGFGQALTTSSSVKAFLALDDVSVPYVERSRLLGNGAFPLSLDGPDHTAVRNLIAEALTNSRDRHAQGVTAARAVADKHLLATGNRLDLVGQLVEPALHAWIEQWYGLKGCGLRLARAGRLLHHATFLNPAQPSKRTDTGALRFAIDALASIATSLADHLATQPPPAGTVAACLLADTDDPHLVARHLIGLAVGPLALGSQSIAEVFDDLLDRSWELDGLAPAPGETPAATAHRAALLFGSTLARRPPLPGVVRHNPIDRSIPVKGGPVVVPEGQILVATSSAMALDEFDDETLVFGWGSHACLGRSQITEVAASILSATAARSPRRLPGAAGRLRMAVGPTAIPKWPFPGHLEAELAN